jgi:hypothetical protein
MQCPQIYNLHHFGFFGKVTSFGSAQISINSHNEEQKAQQKPLWDSKYDHSRAPGQTEITITSLDRNNPSVS